MSDSVIGSQHAVRDYIMSRPRSELLSLRKRITALEARERMREAGRSPKLKLEFTSQYGEDTFLWELFDGKLDGFYIEVGAFDGYSYSVTYPFEALGWSGLLVEPIPERYEACVARRPGSRVVHAALSGPGSQGTCNFTVVAGGGVEMLSFLKTTAENYAEVRSTKAPTKQVTVPLTSMDALLEGHRGPIDFAVLDVEGGEIDLLKGFNLAKHRPRVLLIEEGMPGRTSPVMQYLAAFPYTPANYAWINRVYIHNDEPEMIARAREISVW